MQFGALFLVPGSQKNSLRNYQSKSRGPVVGPLNDFFLWEAFEVTHFGKLPNTHILILKYKILIFHLPTTYAAIIAAMKALPLPDNL